MWNQTFCIELQEMQESWSHSVAVTTVPESLPLLYLILNLQLHKKGMPKELISWQLDLS